ncbi:type I polyketide synthase [Saccharothrix yanglingensis]|uniref:Modular polyketide synthase n=1 Tax=Saccharothrix yanglingensis TaxID=659496 RepID=A0ABU0X6W7_9PSEU|nr:beta-ketoacyl synthase N-terminal-like domain-containing protein [Saccharothrix yanglingensis]MDQ2587872.1 modular polyketide synthase [Saccharothrix yanglingensis]
MPDEDVATIRAELLAAYETIQQQQRSLEKIVLERLEPIAVVGTGLRFPGGNDTLDGFEEFLRAGGSGIGPLPRERWDVADQDVEGRIGTVAGGFLDRVDEFDAQFFNIPPKSAPYVDPQQRLLLETAWEALENANIDPTALRHGNGAVYVGASPLDFALGLGTLGADQLDGAMATGLGAYSLSGRLSYFLGWRGPSLTADTACASSLTALHLAVEGLRRHESDIALCGAVNALHDPRSFIILSKGRMLSPDGRCKSFDDAADGYARAEGCGVLVLKRLSDAWQDGDTVLAIVRGTAIGQDGESAGLTAPNGVAQEAVMRTALANSRLEPADIQYVEAHGTGTPLGDPIEMGSIHGVFGGSRSHDDRLTVGSLKSNIGHMEPAAGVGAVIKVILQLRAGVFYPSLIDAPSGRIPWHDYSVTVPTECRPWEAPVRRATVNGFGVTGAIGVAVLEEAPQPPAPEVPPRDLPRDAGHVFTLSAKSETALRRQIERYRRFVAEHPDLDLADLCHTANTGRAHFRHRVAGEVRTHAELTALLDREAANPGVRPRGSFRRVAFLFTGSGSQHVGMGEVLYERYPGFRARVDECDALFRPHLGRSITDLMFGRAPDAADVIAETRFAHAALFTLEYALAGLWRSWRVEPAVLIGHSVGEVVAATVAGVFSLADGVAFLATRARLIESVAGAGGMAAVAAPVDEVAPLLERWPDLAVAAVNAPDQCVVSGGADSLAAVVEVLRERGAVVKPLRVSSAFHSPLVAGVSDELREFLEGVEFHEPELTVISNETGAPASADEITTPGYWVRHVNDTVRFAAGVAAIAERGRHVMLEVGPAGVLTALARQCVPEDDHRWLASLSPRDADARTIRETLAHLYVAGVDVAWAAVHEGRQRQRVALPTYAFDRRRYGLPRRAADLDAAGHPLLGRAVPAEAPAREFASRISARRPAYLADHRVGGKAFLPAAAHVEVLLALADELHGDAGRPIEDVRFHEAVFLTDRPTGLRTRATPGADGRWRVDVHSRHDGEPGERRCASAVLGAPDVPALTDTGRELLRRLDDLGEPDQVLGADEVRAAYARAGLDYGPEFSRARAVRRHGADLAVCELSGEGLSTAEHLPPPLMDGVTHGLAAFVDDGESYVATGIARVRVFKKPRARLLRSVLRITRPERGPAFTLDAVLLEDGTPVLELSGMAFVRLSRAPSAPAAGPAAAGDAANGNGNGANGNGQVPPTPVADVIRRTLADLLSMDEADGVDGDTTFLELGVDSLVVVDLKDRLQSRLGLTLPLSAVLERPTVDQLATFLDHQLAGDPVGSRTGGDDDRG